jgi:hypothetical protein
MQSFVMPILEEKADATASTPRSGFTADLDTTVEEESGWTSGPDTEDKIGVVRSASIGKRSKPTVVRTKSQEKKKGRMAPPIAPAMGVLGKTRNLQQIGILEPNSSTKASQKRFEEAVKAAAAPKTAATPPVAVKSKPTPPPLDRQPTWPSFGGPDSPTDNKELDDGLSITDTDSTHTPPLMPASGQHKAKPSSESGVHPALRGKPTTSPLQKLENEIQYSRTSAIRRPPPLNMNAVRDAEARGSLTSLPDLIRRATKLASMMNEGKRPASRLDELNMFGRSTSEKNLNAGGKHHSKTPSGLSGMLSQFPPPALGTPTGEGMTPRSGTHWPSGLRYDGDDSSMKELKTPLDGRHPRRKRRCCGMPLWLVAIILFLLACAIAAAVVVPLKILILDKNKNNTPTQSSSTVTGATPTALEQCEQDPKTKCLNGGLSQLLDNDSCSCICTNGFTGSRCETSGEEGCNVWTFAAADGQKFEEVTVGSAIPRLVTGSERNFSIPLNSEKLVQVFGREGLGCESENALVVFEGTPTRAGVNAVVTGVAKAKAQKRDAQGTNAETDDVPTSILVAPSQGAPATTTAPGEVAPTGTASSSGSEGSEVKLNITAETLDFARVATLYILQEVSVDAAVATQSLLQAFMTSAKASGVTSTIVSLSDKVKVDFGSWSVNVGQGFIGGQAKAGVRIFPIHNRRGLSLEPEVFRTRFGKVDKGYTQVKKREAIQEFGVFGGETKPDDSLGRVHRLPRRGVTDAEGLPRQRVHFGKNKSSSPKAKRGAEVVEEFGVFGGEIAPDNVLGRVHRFVKRVTGAIQEFGVFGGATAPDNSLGRGHG